MTSCVECGQKISPIRVDGHCFRCHIRTIGWTFAGGRHAFHDHTTREFLEQHVGIDNIRDGTVERAR